MFYITFGAAIWFLFLNSGIHPTIAGVLVAFCVPAKPVLDTPKFIQTIRNTMKNFPVQENEEDTRILIKTTNELA